MSHWSDRFVGIPHVEFGRTFAAADCWGIACIVYKEQLGIALPDYVLGYASDDEKAELASIVAGATSSPLWRAVDPPSATMPYDIAVFRRGKFESHIGIVVHDGLMLHTQDDDCSKIETYRTGSWSFRLTGIYRHVEMPLKLSQI